MMNVIKKMKVGQNSVIVGKYVVVRLGRNLWRIGELGGDWIKSGTAEEIATRAAK